MCNDHDQCSNGLICLKESRMEFGQCLNSSVERNRMSGELSK